MFFWLVIKLCENIGIFIKIINPLTLGQIKLCLDPENKNPKKKFHILIFQCAKSYFWNKKMLVKFFFIFHYTFMYLKRSVLISRFQFFLQKSNFANSKSKFWFFFFGFLFTGPIYNFIWPRVSIFVSFCIFTQLTRHSNSTSYYKKCFMPFWFKKNKTSSMG